MTRMRFLRGFVGTPGHDHVGGPRRSERHPKSSRGFRSRGRGGVAGRTAGYRHYRYLGGPKSGLFAAEGDFARTHPGGR
jgi:hypothetical protein